MANKRTDLTLFIHVSSLLWEGCLDLLVTWEVIMNNNKQCVG